MVGAGGLGSPVLSYLAAAGVGTIGVIDDDVVDNSNLGRQIIHNDADIGIPKVQSAKSAITTLAPCSINASATASPIPDAAPVTNAVLLSRENMFHFLDDLWHSAGILPELRKAG